MSEYNIKLKKDGMTGHDRLARLILERFQSSVQFKNSKMIAGCSVATWETKLRKAYDKEYSKDDKDVVKGENFYFGLINLKVNATTSWLYDLLASEEDQPFALKPTPEPELPKETINKITQQITKLVEEKIKAAGGAPADLIQGTSLAPAVRKWVKEQASAMKRTEQDMKLAAAQGAADAAHTKISDMLVQGRWRQAMATFYHDFSLYPAAFLRGPTWLPESRLKWVGGNLKEVVENVPMWSVVRPWNAFPAGDASSAQDGGWFIELADISLHQLSQMKEMDGAQPKAIDDVMARLATQGTSWLLESPTTNTIGMSAPSPSKYAGSTTALICQGVFPASELQGIVKVDREFYSVEAWVIAGRTVFARVVATENGSRTYYSAHYAGSNDEVYGHSIGTMLYDEERELNLYVRSRAKNVRTASGPMLEAPMNRFDRPTQLSIKPWTLTFTRPEIAGNAGASIKVHEFRMHAAELTSLIKDCLSRADDLCGIPAMFYANPQLYGALRTSGGIAMLFGAALKGIKLGVANIDMNVVEPAITNIWTHLMLNDKDKSIKQDAKIIARGSSGIIEKQLKANKLEEKVAPILQAAGPGSIPPEFARFLIYQSFKNDGLPIDRFMSNPLDPAVSPLPGPTGPGISSGSAQPSLPTVGNVTLDRRSAVLPEAL